MPLLTLSELSQELSVSKEVIAKLIDDNIITPYGGKARLGEPRFSRRSLDRIRTTVIHHTVKL